MADSTHKAQVVAVQLQKHPNADKLSLVQIWGYQVAVNTAQWEVLPPDSQGTRLGVYICPDSLVDVSRPEFSFLADKAKADGRARIKAMKLRGVLSFGLLVPAPDGAKLGEDLAGVWDIQHYDPPVGGAGERGGLVTGGEVASPPSVYTVKYDLESGRRYAAQLFTTGEPVVVTEKIHGANARYVFKDGVMYCGSRTEWKKEYPDYSHITEEGLTAKILEGDRGRAKLDRVPMTEDTARERAREIVQKLKAKTENPSKNLWWQALEATPALRAFCERNPGLIVYGQVYGAVQDLSYGHTKGQVSFAAFDVMQDGRWLDSTRFFDLMTGWGVPHVPVLNDHHKTSEWGELPGLSIKPISYDFDKMCEMAEGATLVAGASHLREGIVVKTLTEREDQRLGRGALKWVSAAYLERSK